MQKFSLAVYTLWRREVVRFLRQRNRVIGALLQPILFWLLIGSGLSASFQPRGMPQMSYIEYFFPGIILMIILFTSIFSTITIIEDRKEGFLQGVLVSPIPRSAIVLAKAGGGMTLSLLQILVFLLFLFTPLVDLHLSFTALLLFLSCALAISFAITCLGIAIAWPMDSIQGYHAIMSVFLFPLWIFSGAAFPSEGVPGWLYWIMKVNPLSYGLALLQECFYSSSGYRHLSPIAMQIAVLCLFAFCLGTFFLALWLVRRK